MRYPHRSAIVVGALALVLALTGALDARGRKGDKYLAEGQKAEQKKNWDKALEWYEKAMAEDPRDIAYQMGARRVRFQAGQAHVDAGQKLRDKGQIAEGLAEFQKAYAIDPSSAIAEQELKRTLEMIERNKKPGAQIAPADQGLTPVELARKEGVAQVARIEAPPELKPLSNQPISLRMGNQPPKVLFETIGKLAGINVIFDPDYRSDANAQKNVSIELNNSTLEEALDYVGMLTKSFWKPLSPNAIFIAADNPTKHRDYDDSVVRVFYLTNLTTPQELTELATTIRTVTNLRKVFQYNSLSSVIVRGTPDEVMLAEKLVNDLDKPKAEVVIDVIVMETNKNKTRNLAAALASAGAAGLSSAIQFTPRNPVLLGGSTNNTTTTTTGADQQATLNNILGALQNLQSSNGLGLNSGLNSSLTGSSTNTQQLISLARIAKISTNDFSVTLPGALLQAVMSDSTTKILQSPQVRAASGQKATLRIGDKVPIASGGVQPFGGQVGGFSSLYSQFQFVDVGVNVDITPTVHGDKEVTLKIVLEISTVKDHVDIGGISQPIIGQRKVEHEIRIREGEVSLLGGLMQDQDTKSVSGVPGLMSIPGLKYLFQSQNVTHSTSELLIALVPHIVRTPGITDLNLRSVSAGNDTVTRLNLTPRRESAPAAPPTPEAAKPPAPVPQPTAPVPQPTTQPVPGLPVPPAAPPEQPAVPAAPPAPAPQAEAVPRLFLRPAATQAQVGAPITVQFEAENVKDLFAAPFHLKFDPQLLRLTEVKAGNLLSVDGQQIIFTRNILNDSGDATVNLNRLPGAGGITGSGVLAVFTFQAVKPGNAVVTFSELSPRNSQLQPLQDGIPHATIAIR